MYWQDKLNGQYEDLETEKVSQLATVGKLFEPWGDFSKRFRMIRNSIFKSLKIL